MSSFSESFFFFFFLDLDFDPDFEELELDEEEESEILFRLESEDETALLSFAIPIDFLGRAEMGRSLTPSFVIVLCAATLSLLTSRRAGGSSRSFLLVDMCSIGSEPGCD